MLLYFQYSLQRRCGCIWGQVQSEIPGPAGSPPWRCSFLPSSTLLVLLGGTCSRSYRSTRKKKLDHEQNLWLIKMFIGMRSCDSYLHMIIFMLYIGNKQAHKLWLNKPWQQTENVLFILLDVHTYNICNHCINVIYYINTFLFYHIIWKQWTKSDLLFSMHFLCNYIFQNGHFPFQMWTLFTLNKSPNFLDIQFMNSHIKYYHKENMDTRKALRCAKECVKIFSTLTTTVSKTTTIQTVVCKWNSFTC